MAENDILLLLQKYQKVARLLGKEDDKKKFDEIINFYRKHNDTGTRGQNFVEKVFADFVKSHGERLDELSVHPDIKANKEHIADFWDGLEYGRKKEFTIFELNVIYFLISDQYDNYLKKDKKRMISLVDRAVRAKKMENSYDNIKV